jgi:hypothetical protein
LLAAFGPSHAEAAIASDFCQRVALKMELSLPLSCWEIMGFCRQCRQIVNKKWMAPNKFEISFSKPVFG